MELTFKLADFEGPLDLLLYLISKHKLDIMDIPIASLVEQYMGFIEESRERDLEVASEFLEMAARLVYIKTVMLLPKHDEATELKRELEGELIEYQLCKQVAQKLSLLYKGNVLFVRSPMEVEHDHTYKRTHAPEEVLEAYLGLRAKVKRKAPPPASEFSGLVTKRVVSVTSRIIFVLKRLVNETKVHFDSLFEKSRDRSEIVATFLAVLELVKAKRVEYDEESAEVKMKKQPR